MAEERGLLDARGVKGAIIKAGAVQTVGDGKKQLGLHVGVRAADVVGAALDRVALTNAGHVALAQPVGGHEIEGLGVKGVALRCAFPIRRLS